MLCKREQAAGKFGLERARLQQVVRVEELANVDRRAVITRVVIALEPGERDPLRFSIEQTRPQFDRSGQVRFFETVPSQITQRRVAEHGRQVRLLRKPGHQRPLPEHRMPRHAHGRIIHPVTEQPTRGHFFRRGDQIPGMGPGSVEQRLEFAGPDLRVAGHRLAVQTQVVGLGAEQHVGHAVFVFGDGQLVFVAVHPAPAMRALERVAQRTALDIGQGFAVARFVHPARLRHADAQRGLVPHDRVEQRNLTGKRQLLGQLVERLATPKNEAARKGQQVQFAGQPGLAHCRRQPLEGLKRQQVLHAGKFLPRR